jgi:cell wall-associated NlpC family hydrolase
LRRAQRLLGAKHKGGRANTLKRLILAGVSLAIAVVAVGAVSPSSPAYATSATASSWVAATPSASSLKQQIEAQSNALENIIEQYNGITEQLRANQQKERQLTASIAPTLQKLDAARATVGEIATQAYMAGPIDSLTALVSSTNTSDMLDQLTAMDQLASRQSQDINQFAALQADYNQQKQQLDALMAVQNAQQKSLADQRKTINAKLAALYKLRAQVYGSATQSAGAPAKAPAYLPGRGGAVVKFAYAQLGKPYVWAADGPGSYDCSGLTLAAYRTVGITLYHKASVQWTEVHHISRSQLQPGDLVFYRNLGHVAIYIGSGKVIHAPAPGEVVQIASVDMMTPYGYGRP